MSSGQPETVHDQTLMIVESPTVARIIESFRISGLQVWSSSGYCWKPVFDDRKNQLKKRVNPGQTADRKRLKELARWASHIVVATDNDPSGIFLCEAIRSYLKDHSLLRGYVTALTPPSITTTLEAAKPLTQSAFNRLERQYLLRHTLKKTGFSDQLLWIKVVTANLFTHPPERLRFYDEQNRPWRPYPKMAPSLDTQYAEQPSSWYPEPVQPPTTLCLLAQVRSVSNSFTSLQNVLEHLFTSSARHGYPISYPRTAAHGWYEITWERLARNLQQDAGLENVLPERLRNYCSSSWAHEAMHIIDRRHHQPDNIRPLLDRPSFLIFEKLHQLTRRALETVPPIQPKEATPLKPQITTADFIQRLSAYNACAPSSIGYVTDRLINEDFISIQPGEDIITPGNRLVKFIDDLNPDDINTLLNDIHIQIQSEEYNADQLLESATTLKNTLGNETA